MAKKKLNPNRKVTMSVKEIKQMKRQVSEEATRHAVKVLQLVPILVLRDLGWSTLRLRRFMSDMDDVWDSYEKGYLSLEDIEKTIYDETGVTIYDEDD